MRLDHWRARRPVRVLGGERRARSVRRCWGGKGPDPAGAAEQRRLSERAAWARRGPWASLPPRGEAPANETQRGPARLPAMRAAILLMGPEGTFAQSGA